MWVRTVPSENTLHTASQPSFFLVVMSSVSLFRLWWCLPDLNRQVADTGALSASSSMCAPGLGQPSGDDSQSFHGSLLTQNFMEAPKKRKYSSVQNDPEPFPSGGVFAVLSSGPLWVKPAWEYKLTQVDVGILSVAGNQVLPL